MFLKSARFGIRPVEISIEHAMEVTRRVKEKELNLLRTLSLAYDIENSLIESKYYEIFAGASAYFNDYIKQVHGESAKHRDKIRDMQQKVLNEPLAPFN